MTAKLNRLPIYPMRVNITKKRGLNRRGFTVIEVLAATGIMALLLVCTVSMLIAAMRAVDDDLAQVSTDTNAATSLQFMVLWVREAQKITIYDNGPYSGHRLCVILPETVDGHYDRTESDTANPMYFYTSDKSGIVGKNGTWLWWSWKGKLLPIRKDVSSLLFEVNSELGADAVQITITTRESVLKYKAGDSGKKETTLTQRVIYMRNYYNH